MIAEDEAAQWPETAARELGVDDFVVDVRSDRFLKRVRLQESIRRARRYLELGRQRRLYFGYRRGDEDVPRVIDTLARMANISCRLGGGITMSDLARVGVARVMSDRSCISQRPWTDRRLRVMRRMLRFWWGRPIRCLGCKFTYYLCSVGR
jgi:2-methylisocitrate lyase-like PEP mutase family enzyme